MKNTYTPATIAVKKFILEHAPEGLTSYSKEVLSATPLFDVDHLNIQFSREDRQVECDLYVTFDQDYRNHIKDDEGNLWSSFRLTVKINWASYGSTEPNLALKRIALFQEVALFAQTLQLTFDQVYHKIYQSKANIDRDIFVDFFISKGTVDSDIKGMRVGTERIIYIEHPLAHGIHSLFHNGKTYSVIVTAKQGFSITRCT